MFAYESHESHESEGTLDAAVPLSSVPIRVIRRRKKNLTGPRRGASVPYLSHFVASLFVSFVSFVDQIFRLPRRLTDA